jgi:pyridoxal phosphate enzyme (YggS family)
VSAPEPDQVDVAQLTLAHERVLETIRETCRRVGRDPETVTLVAVTKTVPVERIRAAVAAGLTILGENRVQEAETKVDAVDGATWHLVGPLQSNKTRRAMAAFSVIETVASVDLARRVDRLSGEERRGGPMPVYLQVNVDDDPAKAGFAPDELERSLDDLVGFANLEIRGLMTVGRLVGDPLDARPTFVALRKLSDRIRTREGRIGAGLSMGMSDDYPVAVEEGATLVRVGRALFGERPGP